MNDPKSFDIKHLSAELLVHDDGMWIQRMNHILAEELKKEIHLEFQREDYDHAMKIFDPEND